MATKLSAPAKQNRLSPEKQLERPAARAAEKSELVLRRRQDCGRNCATDPELHYGQDKMEGLVRQFGKLKPGLRPLVHGSRHLVTAYKRSDLKRLSRLPWSHVARLASIEDPATRKRLERRCIASKWTFLQLLAHYREELGTRPGGGAPQSRFKTWGRSLRSPKRSA